MNAASFDAMAVCETGVTFGAGEKAGTELRGRNLGPGVSWSTCGGDVDEACGSAGTAFPGTGIEKDEIGITGTME